MTNERRACAPSILIGIHILNIYTNKSPYNIIRLLRVLPFYFRTIFHLSVRNVIRLIKTRNRLVGDVCPVHAVKL